MSAVQNRHEVTDAHAGERQWPVVPKHECGAVAREVVRAAPPLCPEPLLNALNDGIGEPDQVCRSDPMVEVGATRQPVTRKPKPCSRWANGSEPPFTPARRR